MKQYRRVGRPVREKALEREQRFRELFKHSPDAIFVESFDGYVLDVNPAACRLHKLKRDQLIGMHVTGLVPPDRREHAMKDFATLTNGKAHQLESYSWTEDRGAVPVEIRTRPIQFGGQPALLLSVRDISERKAAENELLRLGAIVASSGDAITDTDTEGVIRGWNPAAETLFGYTAEEAVGQPIGLIVPPDLQQEACALINRVLREARLVHLETIRLRKDGALVHIALTVAPLYDSSECVVGTTGIAHDITDRKRLEQDLRRTQRKLTEIQERERQHLARELHDTVLQQLLGVSYQVAGLERKARIAMKDAASEGGFIEALQAHRQEVLTGVSQLRHLIRGLRPPGLEDLGLQAVLAQYVDSLRREDQRPVPEFILEFKDCGRSLPYSVSLSLFRCAQEALRNVLRHARAQEVQVQLHVQREQVTLRVRDDGVGFQVPDRLSHLAKENHFGLVGLEEYVGVVNGKLKVASRPGAGTEVCVRVPLTE